ncbi:hypothetical protein F5B18DRAFT_644842 [Nemania serpens]|nr:hypothetical protein F5B18DRAFT_644842 [Nemania serpens]
MVIAPRATSVYLVIDALDECDEIQQDLILSAIKELLDRTGISMKILLTSRLHEKLLDEVGDWPRIDIQPKDVIPDIKATVKSSVDQIGSRRKFPKSLQTKICDDIADGSEGMFLWATMMVGEIKLADATQNAIKERLRKLPRGILELYDQILGSMLSNKTNVKMVLHWVLGAIRPLTILELQAAFAIRVGAVSWASLEHDVSFDIEGDIKRWCGQLIRISNGSVELVHRSLEDFLVGDITILGDVSRLTNHATFRVEPIDAHNTIADACVTYLLFSEFNCMVSPVPEGREKEARIKARLQVYNFLAYAAQFWMQHWRQSPHDHDRVRELTKAGSPNLDSWTEIHWHLEFPNEATPRDLTPLHLASYLHIPFLLDENLSNRRMINSRDTNQETPLEWASRYGRDGEVEKLRQSEADAHSESEDEGIPEPAEENINAPSPQGNSGHLFPSWPARQVVWPAPAGPGCFSVEIAEKMVATNRTGRLGLTSMWNVECLSAEQLSMLDNILRTLVDQTVPSYQPSLFEYWGYRKWRHEIRNRLESVGLILEDRSRFFEAKLDSTHHDPSYRLQIWASSGQYHFNRESDVYDFGNCVETILELCRYRGILHP